MTAHGNITGHEGSRSAICGSGHSSTSITTSANWKDLEYQDAALTGSETPATMSPGMYNGRHGSSRRQTNDRWKEQKLGWRMSMGIRKLPFIGMMTKPK